MGCEFTNQLGEMENGFYRPMVRYSWFNRERVRQVPVKNRTYRKSEESFALLEQNIHDSASDKMCDSWEAKLMDPRNQKSCLLR